MTFAESVVPAGAVANSPGASTPRAPWTLIAANASTSTPANRKNRSAEAPRTAAVSPPRLSNPGVVPRANTAITAPACIGEPVDSA